MSKRRKKRRNEKPEAEMAQETSSAEAPAVSEPTPQPRRGPVGQWGPWVVFGLACLFIAVMPVVLPP